MSSSELTAREWWLVREVYSTTLTALAECCVETGLPGRILIGSLLTEPDEQRDAKLRMGCEAALVRYKPDVG
jgi:hypothetical protein